MWPFKKTSEPPQAPPNTPIDKREWNEDWQVGDVAECINDSWDSGCSLDPKKGEKRTVKGLRDAVSLCGRYRIYSLQFQGFDTRQGWECIAFRKVRPGEKSETRKASTDLTISDPAWWEKQSPETAPSPERAPEKEREPTEARQ